MQRIRENRQALPAQRVATKVARIIETLSGRHNATRPTRATWRTRPFLPLSVVDKSVLLQIIRGPLFRVLIKLIPNLCMLQARWFAQVVFFGCVVGRRPRLTRRCQSVHGEFVMLRFAKDTAVRLWKDERGASLLEYSVLIGLITTAVIG